MKRLIIVILILGAIAGTIFFSTYQEKTPEAQRPAVSNDDQLSQALRSFKIEDLKVGKGPEAVRGAKIRVHYTGWLMDGKKFDSSLDRNQPLEFTLGAAQVIAGWDRGVVGMKVGGKRKLTIPPFLAYGDAGAGNLIPPSSTLIFEVELLGAPTPTKAAAKMSKDQVHRGVTKKHRK